MICRTKWKFTEKNTASEKHPKPFLNELSNWGNGLEGRENKTYESGLRQEGEGSSAVMKQHLELELTRKGKKV